MCFIKNACIGSKILISSDPSTPQIITSPYYYGELNSISSMQTCFDFALSSQMYCQKKSILSHLLTLVNYNSDLLMKLGQNIDSSEERIEAAMKIATQQQEEQLKMKTQGGRDIAWTTRQSLIAKLFGEKQYKYKFKLKNKLPSIIYKQRNINLAIQMVDGLGNLAMNANLISLCIAACDKSGNWITQNEDNQYYIQGKGEVVLYHGQAIFQKIYPRDVSRMFQNGKINIVIYPKQLLIQFSSSTNSVESIIKAQQIEPLIIKDITVRAKKKLSR